MRVSINIDKIILLDGFDVQDTGGLVYSVEAELARMIASHGLPEGLNRQSREIDLKNGANVALLESSSSDKARSPIGTGIAKSIYESLQRSAAVSKEGE